MAGSYNHIIDDQGNFLDNDEFVDMIENLGDAYEMAEEMYGMIWFLASKGEFSDPVEAVEVARLRYQEGLNLAKQIKNKIKNRGR